MLRSPLLMQDGKSRRARGHISRGALLSLLLHAHLLVPLMVVASIFAAREEAQRADEVDVGFEDVKPEELPADLPPLEPPRPAPPDKLAEPTKKPKPKPKQPRVAEAQKKDAAKPEAEIVVPPLPPMPEPPKPPPPERRDHEKMVDLDNDKEVAPPPDAKFLAQKNNRAEVETRATDTNLEKAQKGEQAASAPSERQDDQVGADKAKIAQLEDEKSLAGRKAPDVTPHANPETAQNAERERERSLLALRDPAPRRHELTPETADLSLPRQPDGDVALPERAVRGRDSDPAHQANGKRVKLALSGKDYEYLFGADAEAERRLAQKQRSAKQGKFQQKQARIQAALENFVPEVQPGNQTALNTRAAPFAAYIARMHRSIHQLWGFGQLEEWDEKSTSSPFNNQNLLTTLELVLNGDGTIEKVTVVRGSGYLPYDVAAIDVAYTAGPYPDPPREIRSANGKIYIHWRFYRDGRQCATSGVDYYILNNPPKGGDRPGDASSPAVAELPAASRPQAPHPMGGSPKSEEGGLRRLTRNDNPAHAAKMRELNEEVAAAGQGTGAGAPPAAEGRERPQPTTPRAEDADARAAAQRWFTAFATGDVNTMTALAAYPFRAGNAVTAKSRNDLAGMLRSLIDETPSRRPLGVQILTAAGLRGAIGKLPPGLDDGSGLLFGVAALSPGDTLIVALSHAPSGWKPVALTRR
jgi:TonB family protein